MYKRYKEEISNTDIEVFLSLIKKKGSPFSHLKLLKRRCSVAKHTGLYQEEGAEYLLILNSRLLLNLVLQLSTRGRW